MLESTCTSSDERRFTDEVVTEISLRANRCPVLYGSWGIARRVHPEMGSDRRDCFGNRGRGAFHSWLYRP